LPRRTIYFRDDLDARVTEAARLARRNRSDWVAMACEAALPIRHVQPSSPPIGSLEPGPVLSAGLTPRFTFDEEPAPQPARLDLEADPEATPSKTELDHDRQARINRAIDRARKR
jgi:hypothetical protein